MIVLKDVDIEKAAGIAAVGAFFHGGQICMSNTHIIVEKEIAREFAEALAKKRVFPIPKVLSISSRLR